MNKPKCILLKLLDTPVAVRVRIVGDKRKLGIKHYVFKRSDNIVGWKIVGTFDSYDEALEELEGSFKQGIKALV